MFPCLLVELEDFICTSHDIFTWDQWCRNAELELCLIRVKPKVWSLRIYLLHYKLSPSETFLSCCWHICRDMSKVCLSDHGIMWQQWNSFVTISLLDRSGIYSHLQFFFLFLKFKKIYILKTSILLLYFVRFLRTTIGICTSHSVQLDQK